MEKGITRREFLYGAVVATVLLRTPGCLLAPFKKKKTCFLYDEVYLKHKTSERHPERPERLIEIEKKVKKADWYRKLMLMQAKMADLDIVALSTTGITSKRKREGAKLASKGFQLGILSYVMKPMTLLSTRSEVLSLWLMLLLKGRPRTPFVLFDLPGIMPHGIEVWGSVYSITWRLRHGMPRRHMSLGLSLSPIGMSITGMGLRIFSIATAAFSS